MCCVLVTVLRADAHQPPAPLQLHEHDPERAGVSRVPGHRAAPCSPVRQRSPHLCPVPPPQRALPRVSPASVPRPQPPRRQGLQLTHRGLPPQGTHCHYIPSLIQHKAVLCSLRVSDRCECLTTLLTKTLLKLLTNLSKFPLPPLPIILLVTYGPPRLFFYCSLIFTLTFGPSQLSS